MTHSFPGTSIHLDITRKANRRQPMNNSPVIYAYLFGPRQQSFSSGPIQLLFATQNIHCTAVHGLDCKHQFQGDEGWRYV